jgi:outer membrane protein TolC
MRKFHIITYCLLLLSTTNTANAQTRDAVLLTVEDAIALALQNNFDILLARNDSAVAALDYSYVNAAFLPRINANTSAVFNNSAQRQTLADGRKVERNGIRSNNIAASVGLNWTVFDGFRMFILKDRAEELVELGELLIKEQIITSISDVVKNYYNIVRQKQQLRTVEEQMSISEDRLKLSQYRLDIGVGVKPDVLQAQIDLNAQRAAQLNQLTLIEQLKQQLNQLMNVTPSSEYDVVDTIPVRMDITLSELSGLETTNAALLVSQKNIELAELTVKERKAERFPTIALTSAYNFNKTNNQAVINPFQPIFNLNRGFNYGVTASVPILNNFNVRRQIKQAELDVQYRQLQFESQRSLINTTLINAFKAYEFQKRAVALEEENIKYVRENLFIVRERYRLAATPYIELREAQRSLEDAYTRLITARYNLKVAETDLLRLKGELVR